MLASVVEPPYLRWIGEQATFLVEDDGVIVPAGPVAEHDLHELVGEVVARFVRGVFLAPHVPCLVVVDRGHDVPGGTALRHQVDRGEDASDVEGLVVAR